MVCCRGDSAVGVEAFAVGEALSLRCLLVAHRDSYIPLSCLKIEVYPSSSGHD